jgi:hypothetical protein
VKNDIPPYSVAIGTPAKVVKRFDFERRVWIQVTGDGRESEMHEITLRLAD